MFPKDSVVKEPVIVPATPKTLESGPVVVPKRKSYLAWKILAAVILFLAGFGLGFWFKTFTIRDDRANQWWEQQEVVQKHLSNVNKLILKLANLRYLAYTNLKTSYKINSSNLASCHHNYLPILSDDAKSIEFKLIRRSVWKIAQADKNCRPSKALWKRRRRIPSFWAYFAASSNELSSSSRLCCLCSLPIDCPKDSW